MPIYEYQCAACGHKLEKLQKVSDEPLTVCPACSEAKLKKLVSAAGFRLKGGGWYETDFKTKAKKNVAGTDAASSTSASAGAGDSSESSKSSDSAKSTGSTDSSTASSS